MSESVPTTRRLRVLIVCQSGLEQATTKQAFAFAEGLTRYGHQVLLSVFGAPESTAREGLGSRADLTLMYRRERGPLVSATDRRAATAFAPDVVHAFNPRHALINAVAQLRRASPSAAVVVHWEDDELGILRGVVRRSPLRRVLRLGRRVACYPFPRQGVFVTPWSLAWVRRHAVVCDALTPALAADVERMIGKDCRTVLPLMLDGGDHSAVDNPLERVARADGDHVVAYTGTVHTESIDDFRLALRAVARLNARGHATMLVHAGHMLPRFDVASLARDAGLDPSRAVSVGYVSFAEVTQLLRAADVLVQPGRPDAFNRLRLPSKVQAYLASGTPTVMFSVGLGELLADREEVVKLTGFSATELADRVEELLIDPELAHRVGDGGHRAAARLFDIDTNIAALVDVYNTAIARSA